MNKEESMTTTTESERYLAIIPGPYSGSGYYGKGATIEEAKQNAKAQGGKLTAYIVYRMPDGAKEVTVGMFGQISWKWEGGEEHPLSGTTVELEVVTKRGQWE